MSKSKIFLFICLAFILGVGLNSWFKISAPFIFYYFVFVIVIVLFFIFWHRLNYRIIFLCLLFLAAGFFRYQLSLPKINPSQIQFYAERDIVFRGRVVSEPSLTLKSLQLTVETQEILIKQKWRKIFGRVLLNLSPFSDFQYGDDLEIGCKLYQPEKDGGFDYHEYLARYQIYSYCYPKEVKILSQRQGSKIYHQILIFKNKFKTLINNYLIEPQGSLLSALVLGLKKEVPNDVKNWFRLTGTAHIMAISGLHVSVMVLILESLLIGTFFISRRKVFYPLILLVLLFVALTGFSASAIRAGIMGLMVAYSRKIGRLHQGVNLLVLAAFLMLWQNPKLLRADAGFQLSFLAMLGIVYFEPYFLKLFQRIPNWKHFEMRQILAMSLGAQIFVLPLILYYFGNLSLNAPLANILILPVLSYTMMFGFIFGISGIIWSFLAKFLVWPVWLLLTYILLVVKFLAGIPYLSYNLGQIHWLIVVGLYIPIIWWVWKINKSKTLTD